jgi:hypothetical protein
MVKTQIQLSDEQYSRLKGLAARLEVSMAELLRRGADYVLTVYADGDTEDWSPPETLDLGGPSLVPVEDWRALANEREP